MIQTEETLHLRIPEEITLEKIIVSCDPNKMVIQFDSRVVRKICDVNDIPHSTLLGNEIALTNLLCEWYRDLKKEKANIPQPINLFFTQIFQIQKKQTYLH